MQITLLPSRRTLEIKSDETILSALRRQAEPISYSCQDGRCGLCRCFLAYPDQDLFQGVLGIDSENMSAVLACQTVPDTDCLVYLSDRSDVLVVPAQLDRAQVVAIEVLADRVMRLSLRPNKSLQFAAGQSFEVNWSSNLARLYSAASLPTDPELTFHIKVHEYGRASRHVAEVLKIGDSVRLRGPLGAVYLRRHCMAPILCISNNTGLGPLLALLRTIADAKLTNPVYVFVGFTTSENAYWHNELQQIAKQLRNLRRCEIFIGGGDLRRGERRGLLIDAIHAEFDSLSDWRVYAFGSPHAIEATSRILHKMGVAQTRLHTEPYHYSVI